jgi:hypothetical protein
VRHRSTNAEKQCLRGIIHNLSLQRWTDQEITDYLHKEKNIDIARITVNGIRNRIEKEAEKWYIELRQSRYKFIATYKERLDSLLSYQKKLNDILTTTKKEETKIRAITALQSIELDIFNIFKQLPDLRIEDVKESNDLPDPDRGLESQVWGSAPIDKPRALDEESYSDEENRNYFEQKMKKYEERISNALDIPIPVNTQRDTSADEIIKDNRVIISTDQDKDREDEYVWKP